MYAVCKVKLLKYIYLFPIVLKLACLNVELNYTYGMLSYECSNGCSDYANRWATVNSTFEISLLHEQGIYYSIPFINKLENNSENTTLLVARQHFVCLASQCTCSMTRKSCTSTMFYSSQPHTSFSHWPAREKVQEERGSFGMCLLSWKVRGHSGKSPHYVMNTAESFAWGLFREQKGEVASVLHSCIS